MDLHPLILESGGDLLSRAVSSQVPSALKVLTSVFGMGTGGTPSPLPPDIVSIYRMAFAFACPCSLPLPYWPVPRHKPFGLFLVYGAEVGDHSLIILAQGIVLSSGSLPLPWSLRSCLPGCSPFRLVPCGTIKFNACCAFTLRYSRPLSHLDNCTVKKNYCLSRWTFSSQTL